MLATLSALLTRKVLLTGVALIGVFGFSGCDLFGGIAPANAHLGNNNITDISLSAYAGEVDVTLDNPIAKVWVQEFVNCGGDDVAGVNCLANWVNKLTAGTAGQAGADAAATDVGYVSGYGQVYPYGDEWNASVEFAWGGDGSSFNCIGFHATFGEGFVTPTNPAYTTPPGGSWYTVWPLSPSGWNGDGAAEC